MYKSGEWTIPYHPITKHSFYAITGQKLLTLQLGTDGDGNATAAAKTEVYFGGKLIQSNGVTVDGRDTPNRDVHPNILLDAF